MDKFKAVLHGTCCKGGIYCEMDRPEPRSSRGARRLRRQKQRTRKLARLRLRREARDMETNE